MNWQKQQSNITGRKEGRKKERKKERNKQTNKQTKQIKSRALFKSNRNIKLKVV